MRPELLAKARLNYAVFAARAALRRALYGVIAARASLSESLAFGSSPSVVAAGKALALEVSARVALDAACAAWREGVARLGRVEPIGSEGADFEAARAALVRVLGEPNAADERAGVERKHSWWNTPRGRVTLCEDIGVGRHSGARVRIHAERERGDLHAEAIVGLERVAATRIAVATLPTTVTPEAHENPRTAEEAAAVRRSDERDVRNWWGWQFDAPESPQGLTWRRSLGHVRIATRPLAVRAVEMVLGDDV